MGGLHVDRAKSPEVFNCKYLTMDNFCNTPAPKGPPLKCRELPHTRRAMQLREVWVRNVLTIYAEKTREEVEKLFDKIFDSYGV